MSSKLTTLMHVLCITALLLVIAIFIIDAFDPRNRSNGELGWSIGLALIYAISLAIGFCGWVTSIIVLLKMSRLQAAHRWYAIAYVIVGLCGFSLAYYYMQAS